MCPRLVPLALVLGLPAGAQSFQHNTTDVPTGGAPNSSYTENLSFADVDSDGDLDVVFADGGDVGNDRNRIWINQGGAQAGTLGVFVDDTAARIPNVQDASRDIDFADIDLDGDQDFFASNSSGVANQGSRFYVNQGGAQAGTEGFFVDATSTAFVNVGVNDGTTTFSSVDAAIVLPDGNWVDWSCDSGFADLDNDGDLDLVHTTYGDLALGKSPSRIFLNDGAGHFEEFNPSGFQLTGTELADGEPGIWAEGLQKDETTNSTGVECDVATRGLVVSFGDFDGDLDVDILHGEKVSKPRVFTNRLEESGSLSLRDRSHAVMAVNNWAPGKGSYEQDMGDFDSDGDLDIYGTGWDSSSSPQLDYELRNLGTTFSAPAANAVPETDHGEPDFIDYDNDGDLDLFLCSETKDERIVQNAGSAGGYALTDAPGELPAVTMSSQGADVADVDQDGDYDLFVGNDLNEANVYYENTTQTADTTAPRVLALEQAADRDAGFAPTSVRVHVYDNTTWALTQYATVTLEYSVGGGGFSGTPMTFSGGQVFRGEIPGLTTGMIDYRVRATDGAGNVGLSPPLSFTAGPCTGDPVTYCTAKVNSMGCAPTIGWAGTAPSMSQATGFFVTSSNTLDNKTGLFFYGYTPKASLFQGGWLCVRAPSKRTALQNSGGSAPCNGLFSYDFNARIASGVDANLAAGLTIYGQYWSRDPQSSFNTNRSDAIQFTICP